jgi:hypothetical protein
MKKFAKLRITESQYYILENFVSVPKKLYHGSRHSELSWDKRSEHTDVNMLGFGYYLTSDYGEAHEYATEKEGKGYIYYFSSADANIIDWKSKVLDEHRTKVLKDKGTISDLYVNSKEEIENYFKDNSFDYEDYSIEFAGFTYDWDEFEDYVGLEIFDKEFNKIGSEIKFKNTDKDKIIPFIKNDILQKNLSLNKVIDIDRYSYFYDSPDVLSIDNIFDSYANLYTYLTYKFNSTIKATYYFVKMGIDGVMRKISTMGIKTMTTPYTVVAYNMNKFKIIEKEVVSK